MLRHNLPPNTYSKAKMIFLCLPTLGKTETILYHITVYTKFFTG